MIAAGLRRRQEPRFSPGADVEMARDRPCDPGEYDGRSKPSPGADVAGMSSVPAQMWAGVSPFSPGADVRGVSPITRVTTRVGPEALSLDRRVVNEDVLRAAVGPYKAVSCSYRYQAIACSYRYKAVSCSYRYKAVSCSYRYKATLPKWETHTPVSRDTWRPLHWSLNGR